MNFNKEKEKLLNIIKSDSIYKLIEKNFVYIETSKRGSALTFDEFFETLTNEERFLEGLKIIKKVICFDDRDSITIELENTTKSIIQKTSKEKFIEIIKNQIKDIEINAKKVFHKTSKETYYLNDIIKGDSIEVLKQFPDKSIDCIFADPPYFMQSTTKNGKEKKLMRADGTGEFKGCNDAWDKYKDYEEYDKFCNDWLRECKRVLKDDGTIWVIGSFQNIYRLGYIMQNMGFWILNDVVWSKLNPTPNMFGTRFCNAHETMLWCSKGEKNKFTFNYKTMKYLNNNKQDKSIWNIGICQGNERLKDENGVKVHTTQKPEALLTKIIISSTKPGDIVLDPFFGTGTTGAIAKKYGRNFIGIEKDDDNKYIKAARERINNVKNESNDISNLILEVKPPKFSTKKLIEMNFLISNEKFFNKDGKELCTLLKNGNVKDDEEELSIHKMSAKILNKNNNNGWDYFYVKRNNELVSINDFRYEAQKKNINNN